MKSPEKKKKEKMHLNLIESASKFQVLNVVRD